MTEERCWLLVSLRLSGEASPEELEELDTLVRSQPHLNLQIELFTKIWNSRHQGLPLSKELAFSRHMQRLSSHLAEPAMKYENPPEETEPALPVQQKAVNHPKFRFLLLLSGIAASFFSIVIFIFPPAGKQKISHPAENIVTTKPSSRSKIQLPDGTQVWLNADSRLVYDENFTGSLREVQLSGEAYFDVVKEKNHPFIIHTASIDIRVLGTAFNVRSYKNEKITETSLFRGSVEITTHNNPERKIMLRPNEKLVIQNPQARAKNPADDGNADDMPVMTLLKLHIQKKDSSAAEILWMKNKLSFDGESLENVALKIERWYDVKVSISNNKLKTGKYTAVFENESLQEVMEALRLTGNFTYTISKKEVTIY